MLEVGDDDQCSNESACIGIPLVRMGRHPTREPVTLGRQAPTAESSPPMLITPRQNMSKGKEEGREWSHREDWAPEVGCDDQGGGKVV